MKELAFVRCPFAPALPPISMSRHVTPRCGCWQMVSPDIGRGFEYAEAEGGRRMGEDEVVTSANAVVRFVFSRARSAAVVAARGRGTGAGAGAGAGASAHESKT